MHAARLSTSPRLRRVLAALEPGLEISSLDLAAQAGTVAPGTCVSELRAQGYAIACRQETRAEGRVWLYRLTGRPAATPAQNTEQSVLEGPSTDG